MTRSILNLAIDAATLLAMLGLMVTGLIVRFVLPPGTGGRFGGERNALNLAGMSRHDWGDVHFWLAVALTGLILIHVALHWNWVCAMVHRAVRGPGRTQKLPAARLWMYGGGFMAGVAALVGAVVWLAYASVH